MAGRRRRSALQACTAALTAVALFAAPVAHAAGAGDWRSVRIDVKRVQAAGTTFAWSELGTGQTLILLNGTASPMNEWDPAFLAGLAAANRVVIFDYPGLGDSGRAPSTWSFDSAADWIADFAAKVAPGERVNLLGWSMGGFIAQQLAQRHPELLDSVVLAATNPGGNQAVLGPRWVQEIDSSSSSDSDYVRTNYPAGSRTAGWRFIHRLEVAIDTGAYPPVDTPASTLNAMVAAEDPWLRSNANLRGLAAVRAPTLVIDGAADVITPPVNSRRIAAAVPGSTLTLVPASGHSFIFQLPAQVSSAINDFLATH